MPPTATAPPRTMQGIAVPAESVNPQQFFARTRRHTLLERTFAYTGQTQDTVELRKADILAGIDIRFTGTLTTTANAGAVSSTRRWPYDFLSRVRFSANGQSNIINVSGAKLKVRDLMKRADLTDRSVPQTVVATPITNGSMSQASELWGVASGDPGPIADNVYNVDLIWHVPVAEDEIDLMGAIFLATSSSDLTLTLEYANIDDLIPTTVDATAVLAGTFQVVTRKFSIPIGSSGQIVVPDLSTFHSLIESRVATGLAVGENELRIVGQGAGKSLLRVFGQLWNGAAPQVPVALTDAAFGALAWRYGNNETPDVFPSGSQMRMDQERRYNSDFAGVWGFFCHDFAHENTFRDVVDMGTTSELRLVVNIAAAFGLVTPAVEYVTETVFLSGQAA